MPIGVMINALSVVVGGLVGAVAGGLLKDDFKACGGFIMLATGFRMIKVKMFPITDMVARHDLGHAHIRPLGQLHHAPGLLTQGTNGPQNTMSCGPFPLDRKTARSRNPFGIS